MADGFASGSVWVKGGDKSFGNTWATKKDRVENPIFYWLAMLFYAAGLLFLLYLAFL